MIDLIYHGKLFNNILKVNWLMENYEMAEGVSLPRSTLYNHYLTHCSETKIDPVNAASFGKLIRSVFMGLRTRRLGTRYYAYIVNCDLLLLYFFFYILEGILNIIIMA